MLTSSHGQSICCPDPAFLAPGRNKAGCLIKSVLDFLQNASDDTTVWLDCFSVNQHDGTEAKKQDITAEAFGDTVKACSQGTIVVMEGACRPATRAWCIFEWARTLDAHGMDGLHMHLGPEDLTSVFKSINVAKAECFDPKDKEMILAQVNKLYGSPENFNSKLKLQLMLQPLRYKMDLGRLMERANGTEWQLGAIKAWLHSPSAGRVLCVEAGAGEGKSTVSAMLATGDSFPDAIIAYHFVKYFDQRRLDPVQVIKSLAFQLSER